MDTEEIEIEADTLHEARVQAKTETPLGFHLLSERVLCDGEQAALIGSGETLEAATASATSKLPAHANVLKTEVHTPEVAQLTVQARDENSAIRAARDIAEPATIRNVSLIAPGKHRFFGLWRGKNQYRVEMLKHAVVELTYKPKARIAVRIGQVRDWPSLVSTIRNYDIRPSSDSYIVRQLYQTCPYHILFIFLSGERALTEVRYCDGIPFLPVTSKTVDKARKYVESPALPSDPFARQLLAETKGSMTANRYTVTTDGRIGRKPNIAVDLIITQIAACLRGLTIPRGDFQARSAAVYQAIDHYQSIPIVSFFFLLPYIDRILHSEGQATISPAEARLTVYMGVEGLLLELYNEISQGQVVSDAMLVGKVRACLEEGRNAPLPQRPLRLEGEGHS